MTKRIKYIIGIDEVGRGPLAGSVVVAAVAAPYSLIKRKLDSRIFANKNSRLIRDMRLRDSKKLSPRQREIWFEHIRESQKSKVKSQRLYYAVASVSPKVIDKINISNAANLAATRAFQKLVNTLTIVRVLTKNNNVNAKIFLDGGLYLKELRIKNRELRIKNKKLIINKRIKTLNSKFYILNSRTIIKGDEKIPAIALASIVAKVVRDRMMKKLHKKYPKYGFDRHKGYGTKKHFKMIRKYGPSPIHRKSFRIK